MFKFRLQTVLDLRLETLHAAEQAYLLAKSKREDAEADLAAATRLRDDSRLNNHTGLTDRLAAEAYVMRLDDEARALEATLGVLQDEETALREAWIEARKEAQAIEKLKEKAQEEHAIDMNRREQAELDEWAVLRRAS